jgi:hypothetical protein
MGSCRRPAGERRIELGIREWRAFPGQDGTFLAALIFQEMKNPPAGFREGFQLVRLVMRELRLPLESPWGP